MGKARKKERKKIMKKMKKFLAMMLAMAMVLGMSVTAFAAGVTITVKDAEDATLKYVQAIKEDRTELTGWTFTSDAIAEAYMSAFDVKDPQVAIIMLAKADNASAYNTLTIAKGISAATSAQIDKALSNVVGIENILDVMEKPQTVTAAGIYVIKAEEAGYTYKNMAASVGFGEVKNEDGSITYPVLQPAEVTAKKSSNVIKKENMGEAADNAVAVGDTVEFKVTSNFPYVDANANEKSYVIKDTLVGATFERASVAITIGENNTYSWTIRPEFTTDDDNNEVMIIDLSGLITGDNVLANQEVVITYSAKVTAVSANNKVEHFGTDLTDAAGSETNLYTGSITITKEAEDGTNLNDAEFVVAREVKSGAVEDETDNMAITGIEYATFDNVDGELVLSGWVKEIEDATHVKTAGEEDGKALGTVTVNGLDVGDYAFIEVKAPEGYSINDDASIAKLSITKADEDGKATGNFTATTSMTDTRLASLPSTGGIGTTIFTIGGCAIMIIAAGLYFSLRRRTAK